MKFNVYRLYFKGNLHLGDVRLDYGNTEEQVHSDTLQAAIIAALAAVGQPPNSGDLPFAVSSLFPFYTSEKDKIHYFFPRPMLRFNTTLDTSGFAKKMKKVQWLDQYYFEKMLGGAPFSEFGGDNQLDFQEAFAHRYPISTPFMFTQTIPRVKVPRNYESNQKREREPQIFYMQVVRFAPKAGFYFLASGEPSGLKKLEYALHILQDEGLGTDRYIGNGHFSWEKDQIDLNLPETSTYMTNISLFCPESPDQLKQMIEGQGHYELKKRSGWITTEGDLTIRKRAVYMMREGSIFKNIMTTMPAIAGAPSIDFKPDRTVKTPHIWRSGKAIFLPVNL